jgi:hypothetical protein
MELTYRITLKDWKDAIRLHSRQKIGRRIHFFIYDYVFLSLALLSLALFVFAKLNGDTQTADALLMPVVALVAISVIVPIVRQYSVRKIFKGTFPTSETGPGYSLDINEERILSTRPGIGEATYYWTGIRTVAQNKKVTLFYISDLLFLVIPVRAMSPDQHAELNHLIAHYSSKGKPC